MNSLVRQTAGIGFTGARYEESFVLADVNMTWSPGRDEVMLFFSPAGLVVVAPLPNGTYRIVATLDDAPEQPGIADVQALLDTRGPTGGVAKVSHMRWSSRFRLHHRVADHYRRDRFLLIGDAAHVHSPAGGQGMNTGLVDACVLGRILTEVLSGRRDASYLDTYEAMRRPAAQQVLQLAGRLTQMATIRSAPKRLLRNAVLRMVNVFPMAQRRLAMNLSGLSRRAAADLNRSS
jgi:2-polyprenyl-6-methoxyphenol hydroxylase-like FAD-dependent oxidoreductase